MNIKKILALLSSAAIIAASFSGCTAKSASAKYEGIDFCNSVVDYNPNYDVIYNVASITEKEWAKKIDNTTCQKKYNESLEKAIPYYTAFKGVLYPLQEDKITFKVGDSFYDTSIENNQWAYIININENGFNFNFVDTKFQFHNVFAEIEPSPRNATIDSKINSGNYSKYTKYEENGWIYATIKNDDGTYGLEINRIFNDDYFLSVAIGDDFTFTSENEAIVFAKQLEFIVKITDSKNITNSIDLNNLQAGIGKSNNKTLRLNTNKFTATSMERYNTKLEDETTIVDNSIIFNTNNNDMFVSEYMSSNYLESINEFEDYEYKGVTFKIIYNSKDYRSGNFTIGVQTDKGFYNFGYTNTQKTNDYDGFVAKIIDNVLTIE